MSVALVTGAARGIGAAIAAKLEKTGFTVARGDVHWETNAANRFTSDLADVESHPSLIEDIVDRLGAIDCLVNNAGIASPVRGDFVDMAPETFDRVMSVNLRGTMFFTQAVTRAMLKAKPGPAPRSIIFITSASAEAASPERLDYCMSKAALSMLVKGLALRLAGHGIAVFEVRPGIIRTQMTEAVAAKYEAMIASGLVPEGRWGKPRDIAAIVASLASGSLPFATGSVIDAGGGLAIPRL